MGKLFINDGAECRCKFGSAPGKLKVSSQNKLIINAGNKIATSKELQNTFYPPAFGTCNYNSPFTKKCCPSVIKWSSLYKSMRLPGNAYPLLPESKATCAIAGTECIEITDPGQIEVLGESHTKNATAEHQGELDPVGNINGLNTENGNFEITGRII